VIKDFDSRLQEMQQMIENEDMLALIRSYNCFKDYDCSYLSSSPHWTKEAIQEQELWYKSLFETAATQLLSRGISLVFDDSVKEMPSAPGLMVRFDKESESFVIISNPYDLENDLRSPKVMKAVQDLEFAKELYAAFCNVSWYKNGIEWGCSWRYAGEIVAELRNVGEDYLDFYCSGYEGRVTDRVAELLNDLNWLPSAEDLLRNNGGK
jgi:hypothetical protein